MEFREHGTKGIGRVGLGMVERRWQVYDLLGAVISQMCLVGEG